MAALNLANLAGYYFVSDLPGSTIPASRLLDILERLEQGRPLTSHGVDYLRQAGLVALGQLARGDVAYAEFAAAAAREQIERERLVEAQRQAKQALLAAKLAEQAAREAAWRAQQEAAQLALESDPRHIANMETRALLERYEIYEFIEPKLFPRLMSILHRLDQGERLADDDALWLKVEGKTHDFKGVRVAFHAREAEYFHGEYTRTNDPWNAVNASSHYRKCEHPEKAHEVLVSIPAARRKAARLHSAIATTHGGAMRDMARFDEAMTFGNQAHALTPDDYRPCTLLGAVNFELGNYAEGRGWYDKAVARGATEHSIDDDLRGIFLRANRARRAEIRAFLLREDPQRYRWVNSIFSDKSGATSKRNGRTSPSASV